MPLDDAIVCYYFRALQCGVFPYICKLGHCRLSLSEPSTRGLSIIVKCFKVKEDAKIEKQEYVRRYLQDVSWFASHILVFYIATLDNV